MRLIDADKLMADIERQPLGGWQKQTVRCVLNDQPTAYDVDKVVEEIEQARCPRSFECAEYRERVIEIVKRGGKK